MLSILHPWSQEALKKQLAAWLAYYESNFSGDPMSIIRTAELRARVEGAVGPAGPGAQERFRIDDMGHGVPDVGSVQSPETDPRPAP